MAKVLDGLRVVELTTMITGSLAGMLLGDLGASVIKIENPKGGDPFRKSHDDMYGGHFQSYNRNKRSMTLDLQSVPGKDVFFRLLRGTDVLIDNFRPGVIERLGFTYPVLSEHNPGLIHASITGFGPGGPYRDRPAFDAVAQSLSGVLSQFLDPQTMQLAGPTLADNISGYYAAYGIMGALFERARTGRGRRVETNMLEATMALAPDAYVIYKRHGIEAKQQSRVGTSQSFAMRCADGKMMAVHLSSPVKFWENLLVAVERPALAEDERFASYKQRVANYRALQTELTETFATRTRAEWAQRLETADVPYAPIMLVSEVFDDPQVEYLETFYQIEHPAEGEVWGVQPPLFFDGERPKVTVPPPQLGEHTDDVLRELGLDAERINELHALHAV
jgi:crotonobetainyl-CoA:carnitine CoA-transferase CaiB-like acyl-CoA transferase